MRKARANVARITLTPEADLGSEVQLSGITGAWSNRNGGSHVEYGDGQIIAVAESPIQVEHRVEVSGARSPKYGDATRLPMLRRTTLVSKARAAYDWLRYPASAYKLAIANIDEAIQYTLQGHINWERKSETVYEGWWSVKSKDGMGAELNYRLVVEPNEHLIYHQSCVAYGGAIAPRNTVNAGQFPFKDAIKDRAIQSKLTVLLDYAQLEVTRRAASNPQNQIG